MQLLHDIMLKSNLSCDNIAEKTETINCSVRELTPRDSSSIESSQLRYQMHLGTNRTCEI